MYLTPESGRSGMMLRPLLPSGTSRRSARRRACTTRCASSAPRAARGSAPRSASCPRSTSRCCSRSRSPSCRSRRRSPALADEAEAPSLPLSSVFPLLGAATADVSESILAPEALLFGAMSGGVALVLALCVQLWTPLGTSNSPPADSENLRIALQAPRTTSTRCSPRWSRACAPSSRSGARARRSRAARCRSRRSRRTTTRRRGIRSNEPHLRLRLEGGKCSAAIRLGIGRPFPNLFRPIDVARAVFGFSL